MKAPPTPYSPIKEREKEKECEALKEIQ